MDLCIVNHQVSEHNIALRLIEWWTLVSNTKSPVNSVSFVSLASAIILLLLLYFRFIHKSKYFLHISIQPNFKFIVKFVGPNVIKVLWLKDFYRFF
jgi:hypothetical protein